MENAQLVSMCILILSGAFALISLGLLLIRMSGAVKEATVLMLSVSYTHLLGVYIHGYAGDRIAEKHYTVIPSVLIERIPQSMNEIKKSNLEKITCVE